MVAELEVASHEILLRGDDNGPGLGNGAAHSTHGGNGIPSMKRRAQSLGGRRDWSAIPGTGCIVEAHVPARSPKI